MKKQIILLVILGLSYLFAKNEAQFLRQVEYEIEYEKIFKSQVTEYLEKFYDESDYFVLADVKLKVKSTDTEEVNNNSNDQKSCFKKWTKKSLGEVKFEVPTLVQGRKGLVFTGEVTSINKKDYDVVYLDPPYTNGVLYDSCYHLNDSMCLWDKPALDYDFAIPRPQRAIFRKIKKTAGAFYSKRKAEQDFKNLLNYFDAKRIILSYSDAPRNIISKDSLIKICENIGDFKLIERDHKICTQAKSQKKTSEKLKEFFFVIDKKQ